MKFKERIRRKGAKNFGNRNVAKTALNANNGIALSTDPVSIQAQLDAATKKSMRGLHYAGKPMNTKIMCMQCKQYVWRDETIAITRQKRRKGKYGFYTFRICNECATNGKLLSIGRGVA